ncbi:hypothetical protein PENSPDRAFT_355407 [Peniophora sp. CONT]|nr:hypothetical protein PENSPDRAFT_355407 [Peniophora sp. CONT]
MMEEPLPLIVATYDEHSVAIPRPVHSEGVDVASRITAYLEEAFPAIKGRTYVVEARVPGLQSPIEILPSLRSDICATVTDVRVQMLLNEEEKRIKQLTELAPSSLTVKAPTEQLFEFHLNLNCADARDLKQLVQRDLGVPIERQILLYEMKIIFDTIPGRTSWVEITGKEVLEDDVLVNCHVNPGDVLRLRIERKKSDSFATPVS